MTKSRLVSLVIHVFLWKHFDESTLTNVSLIFQMIHEGNNAYLVIYNTYEEDTGTFTCRATTAAGQVETSAKLVVKSKT